MPFVKHREKTKMAPSFKNGAVSMRTKSVPKSVPPRPMRHQEEAQLAKVGMFSLEATRRTQGERSDMGSKAEGGVNGELPTDPKAHKGAIELKVTDSVLV